MVTNEHTRVFDELRFRLREERKKEQAFLDEVSGQVFDAYRAVLGDEFTAQNVIRGALFGTDIKNFDELDPNIQVTLDLLCARYPVNVDKDLVSNALSDRTVADLTERGAINAETHGDAVRNSMRDAVNFLESCGVVNFNDDIRQARLLGLRPLLAYRTFLIEGGQGFMDSGKYDMELKLTDTAIKAQKDALVASLEAAGDVKVDYGLRQDVIRGITQASIKENSFGKTPFVVTYETFGKKKGEIDILNAGIVDLNREHVEDLVYRVFLENKPESEAGENLASES